MKFNIKQFSEDVFAYRAKTKQSRRKAASESKVNEMCIRDLENLKAKSPTIHTVVGVCNWMNKSINDYLI